MTSDCYIVSNSLKKPDNILVDYNDTSGRVTDFTFVIGDWGTSGDRQQHYGGTPMYASPSTFQKSHVNLTLSKIYSPLVESQPNCILINQEKSNEF